MFVAVWRYRIEPAHCEAFERAYGPRGDWAELFALEPGYRGTELLRGEQGCYLTLDYWSDEQAWSRFQRDHGARYRALDARLEPLTVAEERIGGFVSMRGG